ncbi:MAG: ferritin [Deltaproteobacteria bacterium]|nr:ferritin [Deltaproteobacteria bacterium]
MMTKKMEQAINDQMQKEFYSSYLYLSMSAYCYENNLKGFGHWMKLQSQEETSHGMKFYEYMIARGNRVLLEPIEQPPHAFKSLTEVIQKSLEHEKKVTALLHRLYELTMKEKDYASQGILQWYINEQVEEEATVNEILQKLKLISDKSSAILYLDKEMGKRAP